MTLSTHNSWRSHWKGETFALDQLNLAQDTCIVESVDAQVAVDEGMDDFETIAVEMDGEL